jgi:hypothetical protein
VAHPGVTEAIEAADAMAIYLLRIRSQPDRTGLQQPQSAPAQRRGAENSGALAKDPLYLAYGRQRGMPEFFPSCGSALVLPSAQWANSPSHSWRANIDNRRAGSGQIINRPGLHLKAFAPKIEQFISWGGARLSCRTPNR